MKTAPKMPDEYKGEIEKSGGYTTTEPRKWTASEIEWVKSLKEQGFTNKEIAESIERSQVATAIKIKRLGKTDHTYNAEHITEKYQTNTDFIKHIHPKTVFDVYAGDQSFYSSFDIKVISNDKNFMCNTGFHMDALEFCCSLYARKESADIIDLDPFGSAYDCFDLAIKMAKKGLVITFGEIGHKRWKRLDYVRNHYGIESLEEFTLDRLIKEVQVIGRRNKKELKVFAKKEWRNIGRVWFEIAPIKITEQWESKI